MNPLEMIYFFFCLVSLLIMGITDIKRKSIDVRFLISVSVLLAAGGIALCSTSVMDRLLGMIPGIIMLVINRISKDSIGLADAVTVIAIGIGMGFFKASGIYMYAFFLCALFALVYSVLHCKTVKMRKQSIPFIPFVFLGVLINEILQM